MKFVGFRMDEDEYKEFSDYCKQNHRIVSRTIAILMGLFARGLIEDYDNNVRVLNKVKFDEKREKKVVKSNIMLNKRLLFTNSKRVF